MAILRRTARSNTRRKRKRKKKLQSYNPLVDPADVMGRPPAVAAALAVDSMCVCRGGATAGCEERKTTFQWGKGALDITRSLI